MADYDALIIGGGSGLTAAYHAEAAGKTVGLVERGPLGGTCVNRGCIPTKTIIQSAEVLRTIREGPTFGVHVDEEAIRVDFPAIMERMRDNRAEGVEHTDKWVEGSDLITLHRGEGRFVDGKTLEVDGEEISGETVFICAGARPTVPPVDGLDEVDFHTNDTILDEMTEQPDRLAVLGAGYIGVEFSNFFAALGTEVTVVESKTCLLREDPDVRSVFTQAFEEYVNLYNGWYMTAVEEQDGELVMTLEEADGDKTDTIRADALLVATGRAPNSDLLDLEATGVETDEHGWIEVDDHLRTSHEDIYAYGDIIGQGMFKHTSSFEGELAWRNSQGADLVMDYRANPHAVFSHPQIGAVGLTEEEADEEGLDYRTAKRDYGSIAKGEIIGRPTGFAKAIVENGTDRILGFHMVGPHAADLIHEVVVAMTCGDGTLDNVTEAIHVHPTMPELVHTVFKGLEE